jgi:hypothetical protein
MYYFNIVWRYREKPREKRFEVLFFALRCENGTSQIPQERLSPPYLTQSFVNLSTDFNSLNAELNSIC